MSLEAGAPGISPPDTSTRERLLDAPAMVAYGIAGVASWFVLFGMGVFINSKPYRDAVGATWSGVDFLMSLLTYTPTNIGVLCVTAAFIGGCASRLQVRHAERHAGRKSKASADGGDQPSESEVFRNEHPGSSAVRGFVVFGTYLAGSFIADADPFTNTTPQLYARAAGATSLAAFTVGFDPTVLYGLIGLGGRGKSRA